MKQFNIPNNFLVNISHDDKQNNLSVFEKYGKSFAKIYWYHDDQLSLYITDLYSTDLHKGFGTEILSLCENIGRELGMENSYLWVDKNTWMHDWYKRIGYVDLKDYKDRENFIWMQKPL